MSDIHKQVDQLLHDAERAGSGAEMANMLGDNAAWGRLIKKRKRLIAEAVALDPERTAPAWKESGLNA